MNGVAESSRILDQVHTALEVLFPGEPQKIAEVERLFQDTARQVYLRRPIDLKQRDGEYLAAGGGIARDITYVLYVDQFATADDESGDFDTARAAIPYLQALGVTKLYVLPFVDSPMKDAGFDVRNYRDVRQELGGMEAFERFATDARAAGLTLQMDVVFNHVSDQHEWAQRLLDGDMFYKDYFVVAESEPQVIEQLQNEKGVFIRYRETVRGREREVTRRLIFAGLERHHFRRIDVPVRDDAGAVVGEKPLWVLHTFYNSQWDLNIECPAVLGEFMDVLGFWANHGVKTFRMDAVPFLVKTGESEPGTLAFVELMNRFLRLVAPSSNLLVEAAQPPDVIRRYFGESLELAHPLHDKSFNSTSHAQLAYGFTAMPYMWASLLTGEGAYLEEGLRLTGPAPQGAAWNFFLRNHDELTLEMAEAEIVGIISERLGSRGHKFRDGLGVAGRMASFFDHCPDRITLAHALLLAMPGEISLYFGDEIGVANDVENMLKAAQGRGGLVDARDAGRGRIPRSRFEAVLRHDSACPSSVIWRRVRALIEVVRRRPSLSHGSMTMVPTTSRATVAFERTHGDERTLVLLNLSDAPQRTTFRLDPPSSYALTDLVTGAEVAPEASEGEAITLTLPPYATLFLASP